MAVCKCIVYFYGVVATVDSSRTGVLYIYHIKWEILISQGSSKSDCCKVHHWSVITVNKANNHADLHMLPDLWKPGIMAHAEISV